MTMRPETRRRILDQAWATPLGLLRLDDITSEEALLAAGGQPREGCENHDLSDTLFTLARRLRALANEIAIAEDEWNERNR